MAIDT